MSPADGRALRNATLVLLLLSAVRWVAAVRAPEAPATADGATVAALQEASQAALDDARRRAEPLAPGERLDPNRASAAELDRLPGVGRSTAEAIVRTRASRPFASAEELVRVPGVGPATLARMAPHLELRAPPVAAPGSRRGRADPLLDLNRATDEELQGLPGIGPALAARILAARQARRFSSVDDLLAVPGIGPATLERLRPLVRIGGVR